MHERLCCLALKEDRHAFCLSKTLVISLLECFRPLRISFTSSIALYVGSESSSVSHPVLALLHSFGAGLELCYFNLDYSSVRIVGL